MNPISSTTTSNGFSTSAWQALERAAVKRRSAATVLNLLTRLMRPAASTITVTTTTIASSNGPCLRTLAPPGDLRAPCVIDAPFERWAALTDAYAEQFLRMQRGDKGAREKAIGLSQEMLRMNEAMNCTV